MISYIVWNNKGGTGKTSLTFQMVCEYSIRNTDKKNLVIDMCPQANISELLLGGLVNGGNKVLLERQGRIPRCSIGGYFEKRMPSAHQTPKFNSKDYITKPSDYNSAIPENIDLVCGDPLLELQSIAMNSLANLNIPGVETWMSVIDWLKDFLDQLKTEYDTIFIDTNPSFAIYTQIALAASDRIILPVMADDSSRRAIRNAFSLVYGIHLPSQIYEKYTFASTMKAANRSLPKIHLIIKNRLTQYMGSASAFTAVLSGIDKDVEELITNHKEFFSFQTLKEGMVDIRDFSTTGVVAFARGTPFSKQKPGKLSIGEHRVQVTRSYLDNAIEAIKKITDTF